MSPISSSRRGSGGVVAARILYVVSTRHRRAQRFRLQQEGFIQQVAPNQCGGGADDEIVTENRSGALENLTFNIIVP